MLGLVSAFLMTTTSGFAEQRASRQQLRSFYVADGGLREAAAIYTAGGRAALEQVDYPRTLEGTSYTVAATWGTDTAALADDLVRLTCTADVGGDTTRLEVILRSGTPPVDIWRSGFFAEDSMEILSNALFDSYDSSAGTYASQVSGSFHGVPYAATNAPVSSNGGIRLDSNASIWGNGAPGPSSSTSISGGSRVSGSTTPLTDPVSLPSVTVPSIRSSGSINMSSGRRTLSAGNHGLSQLNMDSVGVLTVEGPATLVVGDFFIDSNSELRIDSTHGPVELYVTGDFEMKSNVIVGDISGTPGNFSVFIDGRGSDALIDSNVQFTGTIHAPERSMSVLGNSIIWGALAVKDLFVDSNSLLHYDESLLGSSGGGGGGTPTLVCWRRLGQADL